MLQLEEDNNQLFEITLKERLKVSRGVGMVTFQTGFGLDNYKA